MSKNYSGITPESISDELMMIAGRIEAIGAYYENTLYPDADLIASMLGLDANRIVNKAKLKTNIIAPVVPETHTGAIDSSPR